jgi:hypothetical protein
MNFGVPGTLHNQALSAAVSGRIRSEARIVTAEAAMRWLVGIGALCLLLGAGVGAALFGYSYITDGRTSLEKLTTAVADGLDRVVLKVGDVAVKGSVPLDTASATVRLDTRGSTVALATNGATAQLGATVAIPHPSERQLFPAAEAQPDPRVVTSYTIFKNAKFGDGDVVTGWNYSNSEDAGPVSQFCYYTAKTDDYVASRYEIATDHVPTPSKRLPVDLQQALDKCLWFESVSAEPRKRT